MLLTFMDSGLEKTILAMVLRTYCHNGSIMELLRLRGPYGLRV